MSGAEGLNQSERTFLLESRHVSPRKQACFSQNLSAPWSVSASNQEDINRAMESCRINKLRNDNEPTISGKGFVLWKKSFRIYKTVFKYCKSCGMAAKNCFYSENYS